MNEEVSDDAHAWQRTVLAKDRKSPIF
jgi:hypothetical protein